MHIKNLQKLKIFFIPLFLFLSFCTDRQNITNPADDDSPFYTEINGSVVGSLTLSASPYLVTNHMQVDSGQTLSIDPGVIIHFTDSARFTIYGSLTAIGNLANVIQFSANVDHWKGIKFINASNSISIIQFAVIEKVLLSQQDSTDFGAIEINNSNVTIKNCILKENEGNNGGGIAVVNSVVEITNNIFRENSGLIFGGGLLLYQSNSQIINNTFLNNYCTNCGAAIALFLPLNENIQNNIIFNNFSQTGCDQFYYQFNDSLFYNIEYNFVSQNSPSPLFVSDEDLKLAFNSPCINAGNPDSIYNDTDGSRNDQGAFGGPDGNW